MKNLQKNQKTFERHDVEGTPFSIIKEVNTGQCKVAIGTNLMTNTIFTEESAARKYIYKKPWELILNTLSLMCINIVNELFNEKQQNND